MIKKEEINMNKKRYILSLMTALPLTTVLYIILHECGHMFVMLYAGSTITEFSILGAHVSGEGGNYTNLSDLCLHAAGVMLPLMCAYAYMVFYRKSSQSCFYRVFSWLFSLIPVSSLLAWVIIPFIYMNGNAPAGDDVTKFLYNFSQDNDPVLVSIAAVILMVIGIILMIIKHIPQNFYIMAKEIREQKTQKEPITDSVK